MDELDYASHAAPLGDDNPAGPNLEYEDSYMALGRYLLPKTASMVTSDDQEEEDSTVRFRDQRFARSFICNKSSKISPGKHVDGRSSCSRS